MHTFTVMENIRFGWETLKKRPVFIIGTLVGAYFALLIIDAIIAGIGRGGGLLQGIASLANAALQILFGMGLTAFMLKVHDSYAAAKINDFWHPQHFWRYMGAVILFSAVMVISFIALIIPGFVCIATFLFAPYFVIDKGIGPVEAMKESRRITKGYRWQLFGLLCLIVVINILGALALLIGLLVTVPVSSLAMMHAYRTLAARGGSANLASVSAA